MTKFTLIFISILITNASFGQNIIIDGGLEGHNTFGCDYNNTDPNFNDHYTELTSFAFNNAGEIDIMRSTACLGLDPAEGLTHLGIAHNATMDRYDQFSLNLTQPITAGDNYTISCWMYVVDHTNQEAGRLEFGISSVPDDFGTLCYSTPTYAPNNSYFLHSGTFTAPVSGNYLTVRPQEDNDITDRTWIHVDDFELTGPPPLVPIDCDVITYTGDTVINPLNETVVNEYTFAAEDWVQMTGSVESGTGGDTLVEVRAGQYIEILPPFESKLGTNANYTIAPCTPAANFNQEQTNQANLNLMNKKEEIFDEENCEAMTPSCTSIGSENK